MQVWKLLMSGSRVFGECYEVYEEVDENERSAGVGKGTIRDNMMRCSAWRWSFDGLL